MKNTFYITTPIYYPNAKPHIGTLYSTVIADIFARFYKLMGKKVLFLTGLDQHGQKVFEAAQKEGVTCQNFVNNITKIYKKVFKEWNIEYDIFMETTAEYHTKAVQQWIELLQEKEYIYKDQYSGWYSVSQENFLAEKDIEVVNDKGFPLCPITKQEAIWISQEAYFFKLSHFSKQLLDLFEEKNKIIVQTERIEEIKSFIKQGLKDLCISRPKKDLSWGIPFPNDKDHIVYVWADALNNYISGIGYMQPEKSELFNSFWPCNLHVLAKDIVRFHTIYWFAFLMAADLPLPKKEFVHGWLLVDDQKMSKSIGNIIDPEEIIKEYHPDVIRYYFSTLSTKDDANFSFSEMDQRYTSDLCNNISNLLQRTNALCLKHLLQSVIFQKKNYKEDIECKLLLMIEEIQNNIIQELENYQLLKINHLIMEFSSGVNSYFHSKKPWTITDKKELENIIAIIFFSLYHISIWASPIMPTKMIELQTLLGVPIQNTHIPFQELTQIETLHFKIKKIENYLFAKKKESPDQEELLIKNQDTSNSSHQKNIEIVNFHEFTKNIILVGQIINIEEIPKSSKLYYLTVDFGPEYGKKQIASGIKTYIEKNDLLNIKTIFCYNLEPRKLCGVISEGMILMTQDSLQVPHIVKIADCIPLGTKLG